MTNYITKTIKNGVEANIPVTSVNGQYGDVVVAGKEYNAGEGIEIGTVQDYSAMKGPAPDGFHVPSKDEWVALINILKATFGLANNNTTMGTYLKMPMAGRRYYENANVTGSGSYGYYWSSTPSNTDSAYILTFTSSSITPNSNNYRAMGYVVRCFKDELVIPDNSWTILYDGSSVASGAGVFYNSTDGLISVSGDGITWYTIQDKNLGATAVFNQGDTVNDANSGYFYQWGNNYGFPHSGTITTSSTKVDASAYGPGNYYSSSTFITVASPYDWSSVQNDNLWGGVTGVVTLNNAITNTGVLSVNGQYGDVTIQTGGNYTAGNGIDITNDEIGLDGTYELVGTQGPAPAGFHVPSKDEWVALCGILTTTFGLANSATTVGTYLKMPMAGYRNIPSSDVYSQGSYGYYWSSSFNANKTYDIYFSSTALNPQSSMYRAYGISVRCFKNSPAIPTSSRTTLYQGTGNAGVFWNSADGLISVSGDGTTWYTIMDKNLGATTVFNQGDTETDANCGYFYQWGNNYGFPHSGTVTTSSTQVDASNYGPGNYYNSSTFIGVSASPYDRSSVQNDNLWGAISGTASGNLVVGDKLYKIVTSTTAPASGTASNIITIVTD